MELGTTFRTATAHLKSVTPYSQSRHYSEEECPKSVGPAGQETKLDNEAYDLRYWTHHAHIDERTGRVYIPGVQIKHALVAASSYNPIKDASRGGSAKMGIKFRAGVSVQGNILLPLTEKDLVRERIYAHATPSKPNSGRVWRSYPVIPEWEGDLEFLIYDPTIQAADFEKTLQTAGMFIGIGRWRPVNNGDYGRFVVTRIKWDPSANVDSSADEADVA
jgi:hypothetical protein